MPTRAPRKVLDDCDVDPQFGRNGKGFIQHLAAYIEGGAGTVLGDSDQLEVS
jgi:hypothetical protein